AGLDRSVVTRTKSKIACFAGPSLHDGSKSPAIAVCASAEKETSGADNAASNASAESRARRLTPEEGAIEFMFDPVLAGMRTRPMRRPLERARLENSKRC